MNKALRLSFVAALLLLFAFFNLHSQTCTNNLLSNPGFESGLTGWTTVGTVTVTTDVHSGSKAVAGGGTGYTSVGQALAVEPGTSYSASAWIKGNCVLELRYMTANWARIENAGLLKAVSNSTYQYFTNTAPVPAGAAYVYLLVYKDQGNGFKMDDACLTTGGGFSCAITPSVSNIVCNDNGTPNNTADDRFSFAVNATNSVAGAGYQLVIPQTSQTYNGTYGSALNIQNVPISMGNLTLNFTDNMTANCSATVSVAPPAPCSHCAAFNWSNELSGTGYETFRSVAAYADGSYIGVGHVESDDGDFQPTQGVDMFVVRYGPTGIEQWLKQFGGEGYDQATDVIALSDGGALVVGYTQSIGGFGTGQKGGGDGFALHLDANGNQVWKKFYGGSSDDRFYSAIQLPGGDYAFSGVSYSNNGDVSGNQGDGDGWLIRVSSSGTIVWSKLYGNSLHQNLEDIKLGQGNTLAASGLQYVAGATPAAYQAVAVETSLNGNLNWLKTYTTQTNDVAISMLPNDNGGYLLVLNKNDRPAVARLDGNGNILQSWNISEVWGLVEDAVKLPGNKIAIAGTHPGLTGMQESDPASNDFWLVVVDGNGNRIYDKTFGEHRTEGANCINVTPDGGYLLGGYLENSFGSYTYDAWVVKFGADPCLQPTGLPELNGIVHEIIPAVNNCFTPPGQSFTYLSMQINNTGDVAAGAFKVKFYFSIDNVLSANDVLWSTVNVPSLNIMSNGGPAFISPDQPVPATLAPNRYHVIVVIDSDNQVAESNESNNTIAPFQVEIGAPDIRMLDHAGLAVNVAAGSSFPMQVTLSYLSNGYPMPTNTSMTISVSLVDVSPAIVVGTANYLLSEFNQYNTLIKTVQVNLPANLTLGSRYFNISAGYSFCEDPSNNSQFQYANVTAATGSGIDLELSMVQNTANPVIYSNYTTTLTLVNKGSQAATGVKVKWLKPSGVVYTGGNEFVASQGSFNPNGDQVWTVGSLPANGTATLRVSYFLLQNGAPITYAQVTAAHETDVDSQPNNGTPPTPVQDDEANSGGSAPPVLTPDLTISNLVFANGPGTPGQILAYYFDLANIGNGNAPQDFIVRAWISTNPNFNTTGIQDGIVPTGNFIAGFSATWVPGASTLPTSLAPGQYYLHLWVDADAQVTESNENNNTASAPFLVQAAAGPGVCDDLVGGGYIECVQNNSLGNLEVFHSSTTGYEKATFNEFGEVISNQSAGAMPVYPSYQVEGGNMVKKLGITVVYSQPLPASILSQYSIVRNFIEFSGGYVFFASKTTEPTLYIIKTDGSFNVQATATASHSYSAYFTVNSAYQITPNQFAYVYRTPGGEYSSVYYLEVMDANLGILSSEIIQGQALSISASMSQKGCGQYLVETSYSYIGHRGGINGKTYREGHFENGQFVTDHVYETSVYTSECTGSAGYSWSLLLPDGSTLRASYSAEIFLCNVPTVSSAIVALSKMQGSAIVWTKYVSVPFASGILRLAYSGNEVVFLSGKNGAVFATTLTCLEEETDTRADLSVFNPPYNYVPNMVAGSASSFSFRVYNKGIAPANGFEVRAVLSTDQVYSPGDDITIGTLSGLNINTNTYAYLTMNHLVPANTASGSYYYLLVADVGNVVLESNESNNTYAVQINVTGGAPPSGCNAVTITPAPGQITIAGFSAPHVLIKVFRPNWTVAYECLDNCANPLVVNGLSNGTYHVQVKLIDNGWGTICYLERDVAVNSFGSGNGSGIAKQEDRLSLSFEKVYPNPSAYQVFVDLFSPKEQAATLDFYDIQGRIVHTMNVQLEEGVNTLDVMVYDWKSGTYNVIARGEETGLPAYGRILKVWEE
jgi:hypothetical protein